ALPPRSGGSGAPGGGAGRGSVRARSPGSPAGAARRAGDPGGSARRGRAEGPPRAAGGARGRLLHRAGLRGLRPGRGIHARRRRALRQPDRPLRARPARLRPRRGCAEGSSGSGGGGGARVSGRLTIAVPRGALFGGTLDLLDGLGIDTSEVRSNDRKLLFADIGVVTMRPSDVP